jgi:hypothetical protein
VTGLKTRTLAVVPGAAWYASRTFCANGQLVFGPACSPPPQAVPPLVDGGAGESDVASR